MYNTMETFSYSNYLSEDLSSSSHPAPEEDCRSCVLLQCKTSTTIRDGVQRTVTTRELQLCPAHLKPNTTPSVDLDLSMPSQIILNQIDANEDPLNLLDNTATATDSAAGPIRRRRPVTMKHDYEAKILENYPKILALVNSGSSLNVAIKSTGMGRTTFFKYRHLAELQLVNRTTYDELREQCATTSELCGLCRSTLAGDVTVYQKAKEMKENKKLLP